MKRLLFFLSMTTLIQCGNGNSVSKQIDFNIIPKTPVVILSDFTLNEGSTNEKTIKGPWFLVNYSVTNNSSKTITIQSLLFKVTAISSTGSISTTTATVDPSDYPAAADSYLLELPAGTSATPAYGIYVDSLNKSVNSYNYTVKVEVQGWIGTASQPEDRLYKTVSFSTK